MRLGIVVQAQNKDIHVQGDPSIPPEPSSSSSASEDMFIGIS